MLLLLTLVVFLLFSVLPTDPARLTCGKACTPVIIEANRHRLGLDLPVWQQYWEFLKGLFVGRTYGSVQVQISVSGGRVTDITALAVPQNDPRSAQISQYAVPQLVSQALAAQSASIAGISGATYTSQGFMQSLASALTAAGIG